MRARVDPGQDLDHLQLLKMPRPVTYSERMLLADVIEVSGSGFLTACEGREPVSYKSEEFVARHGGHACSVKQVLSCHPQTLHDHR